MRTGPHYKNIISTNCKHILMLSEWSYDCYLKYDSFLKGALFVSVIFLGITRNINFVTMSYIHYDSDQNSMRIEGWYRICLETYNMCCLPLCFPLFSVHATIKILINVSLIYGWLVVFYVPSTARSFRDGTLIYCPLQRTWSSVFTLFPPGIEPQAIAWQSITLLLRHASFTFFDLWNM